MLRRKLYFVIALVALLVIGFLATSLTSYYVATDSLAEQISEQTLPLTSDNIYSEIQRDLLRPILISSLMASDTFLRSAWRISSRGQPVPAGFVLAVSVGASHARERWPDPRYFFAQTCLPIS